MTEPHDGFKRLFPLAPREEHALWVDDVAIFKALEHWRFRGIFRSRVGGRSKIAWSVTFMDEDGEYSETNGSPSWRIAVQDFLEVIMGYPSKPPVGDQKEDINGPETDAWSELAALRHKREGLLQKINVLTGERDGLRRKIAWTNSRPTKPGIYWRNNPATFHVSRLDVCAVDGNLMFSAQTGLRPIKELHESFWYIGPIPESPGSLLRRGVSPQEKR